MFDKIKFAQILKKISETYDNQRDFSKKSDINRTYLSQYMNMKLEEPPKPKILDKLAKSSNSIVTYEELMEICGYIDEQISNDEREDLIYLYEKLVILEDEHKKTKQKLSQKESQITYELFNQVLQALKNPEITPETFNPYEILSDIDFISENTKERLAQALKEDFNYYFNITNIKREISNIKYKIPKRKKTKNEKINIETNTKFYMCPVYGSISAGQPNWAEECIEGRIPIDTNLMDIVNPEECFFLHVNGESMNKVVRNGAYALIRKTDWVENGEIAVVLVNGYDATLKKFTKNGDVVVLEPMSDDSSFQTQIYTKETPIKILGKYIGKFEMK